MVPLCNYKWIQLQFFITALLYVFTTHEYCSVVKLILTHHIKTCISCMQPWVACSQQFVQFSFTSYTEAGYNCTYYIGLCKQVYTWSCSCFIGHGLTVQHFRMNPECGRLEELPPIDQNLQYDFNFQQTVHLPTERTVLPVRYCILIWPDYMDHSWYWILQVFWTLHGWIIACPLQEWFTNLIQRLGKSQNFTRKFICAKYACSQITHSCNINPMHDWPCGCIWYLCSGNLSFILYRVIFCCSVASTILLLLAEHKLH